MGHFRAFAADSFILGQPPRTTTLSSLMKYTIPKSLYLLLFLALFSPSLICASEEKTVHIYYTGNGNGEIEPCGCSPKASYGGLKRRAQYLSSIPRAQKGIIIETGNFAPEAGEQGFMKLDLILNSMKTMNYDVMAIQNREKEFMPTLNSFSNKMGLPVIAMGNTQFTATFSKDVAGSRFFVHSGVASLNAEILKKPGVHILLVNETPSNIMMGSDLTEFIDLVINTEEKYSSAQMSTFVHASINKKDGQTIGHISLTFDGEGVLRGFTEEHTLLSPEIQDHPKINPLFNIYNEKVAAFFEKKSREKKLTTGIFLGEKNCKTCHENFWNSWKETRHSNAWNTLVTRGKTSDPDCVPCHTVGYEKEGGFINKSKTPDLTNVQCEVCHGAGVLHTANFSKRLKPVNKNICLTCHNEKHSPDFNYEKYYKKILH